MENKGDAIMIMSMTSGGVDTGKTTVALTGEIEAFCRVRDGGCREDTV